MGLKLQGIPSALATRERLAGRTVAIDAPNLLYAFYTVQLLHAEEVTPARREAAFRSATRSLLTRVQDLSDAGARAVVVLEGPAHPLKEATLAARDATRAVPPIRGPDYAELAALLRARGVPHVQAPHDAEAQACAMARRGKADVVATTDWDALAMGAPLLLRNLSAHPGRTEGRCWTLVDCAEALSSLGVTRETLAAAAVLMGCDYFPGFPGIGPKKAIRTLADKDLPAALDALGADAPTKAQALAAYAILADPPATEAAWRRVRPTTLDAFAPSS